LSLSLLLALLLTARPNRIPKILFHRCGTEVVLATLSLLAPTHRDPPCAASFVQWRYG
jgi:hypothetical protein